MDLVLQLADLDVFLAYFVELLGGRLVEFNNFLRKLLGGFLLVL